MKIGDYLEIPETKKVILLKLTHADLLKIWKRCGLTANYGASYLASSCPEKKDVMNSVSMILNELLENAAKYSDEEMGSIELTITLSGNSAILQVDNIIDEQRYMIFRKFADKITSCDDVNSLYMEKLQSFGDDDGMKSGIGLLTVLSFFNPKMGFLFQPLKEANKYKVSVQAAMPIEGAATCR
jgi:hypothetical protein